jgi:hypothetical protein
MGRRSSWDRLRAAPVITGLTLIGLGSAALVLLRAGATEPGSGAFVAMLVNPIVGLAVVAIGLGRQADFPLLTLLFGTVYVAPIVRLTLFTTTADMGVGCLLLFLAMVEWVLIALVGFAGWHSLESERIRTLTRRPTHPAGSTRVRAEEPHSRPPRWPFACTTFTEEDSSGDAAPFPSLPDAHCRRQGRTRLAELTRVNAAVP